MAPRRRIQKAGAWVSLYVFVVLFLAGLSAALALSYVLIGITSIGYYGPPLSSIMSFILNSVTACAAAGTLIVALVALLRKTKMGRHLFSVYLDV